MHIHMHTPTVSRYHKAQTARSKEVKCMRITPQYMMLSVYTGVVMCCCACRVHVACTCTVAALTHTQIYKAPQSPARGGSGGGAATEYAVADAVSNKREWLMVLPCKSPCILANDCLKDSSSAVGDSGAGSATVSANVPAVLSSAMVESAIVMVRWVASPSAATPISCGADAGVSRMRTHMQAVVRM
jgi:hypothetical protein